MGKPQLVLLAVVLTVCIVGSDAADVYANGVQEAATRVSSFQAQLEADTFADTSGWKMTPAVTDGFEELAARAHVFTRNLLESWGT